MKALPAADPLVDTCIECGFCEPQCPSHGLTLSPRQRIVGWRAISHLAASPGSGADRTHETALRRLSGDRLPLWTSAQPTGAHWTLPAVAAVRDDRPRVVYVPSCASQTMGPAIGDPETTPLPERFAALLAKAGPGLGNLCCGQPFASKGLADIADAKAGEMAAAVLQASEGGALPVVLDTSPCALRLKEHLAGDGRLTVHDITGFIHDHLLSWLELVKQPGPVLLHATCSTRRMGLDAKLQAIAEACAETVVVPDGVGRCGFAGDKGFMTPELNDHALRHLKAAVPAGCTAGYSTSRTCEIGLSSHAGVPYRSIVHLVDACARGRASSCTGRG